MNIRQACKSLIAAELRQYDRLSVPARLKYERALSRQDAETLNPMRCAHGVELVSPCTKCERDDDDCRPYRVAAQMHLKELLDILNEKPSA